LISSSAVRLFLVISESGRPIAGTPGSATAVAAFHRIDGIKRIAG